MKLLHYIKKKSRIQILDNKYLAKNLKNGNNIYLINPIKYIKKYLNIKKKRERKNKV